MDFLNLIIMKRHNFYRALLLIAFCGMAFVGCEKDDVVGERDGMDDERRVSSLQEPPSNQIFYNSTCKLDIQFFESAIQHDYDSVSKYGCVTFASAINEIPAHAFEGDDSITAVALPNSVTTIGDGAFEGCASLYSAIMNGALTIGVGAFSGSKLNSIDLPEVQTIGAYAFYKSRVEDVSLLTVRTIGKSAFEFCPIQTVTLGGRIEYLDTNAFASSTHYQGISHVVCMGGKCPQCGNNPFAGSRPFLFVPKGCEAYDAWLDDGWVYLISRILPLVY